MAAKTIKKSETVIWLPPRAVGERVFASEPQMLALVHSVDGARYTRLSLDTLPKIRSATLVIDARDVTLIQAKLPPLSGAKLRQAVPNVIEDSLLQDTQGCAFGLGPLLPDGKRLIAVVDKAWLEFVVGAIERRSIRVSAAVPAQLALPFDEGVATLACLHNGLAVRTGRFAGIGWSASAEEDFRTEALSAALATVLAPPSPRAPFDPLNPSTGSFARLTAGEDTDASDASAAVANSSGGALAKGQKSSEKAVPGSGVAAGDANAGFQAERLVVCIEDESWKGPVELVAGRLRLPVSFLPLPIPESGTLNMLDGQGGATMARRLADIDWRAWRWPALLATGCLAAFLIGLNLHWGRLVSERDGLRAEMRSLLKTSFAIEDVPGDPSKYMGRRLRDLRSTAGQTGPDDYIPLLSRFAQALGPQANDALTGLEYRDGLLKVSFSPAAVKASSARRKFEEACKRFGLSLRFDDGQNPTTARVGVL
ncbi:MAG: type II secretion system protein GspL [Burkholderiaceae bacterium]